MAFACGLDERICRHIARGSEEAFNIVCEYHMPELHVKNFKR